MLQSLKANARVLGLCLALLWAIELCNLLLGHRLSALGLLPRSLRGLLGIPLSPLLHAGPIHLLVNTLPFALLGGLVMLHGRQAFVEVSLFTALLGGAGVWLFGRPALHVGASGVIFGYFGYLVARGWYSRDPVAMGIAVLTVLFYGGMLWGVVPTGLPVSWEAHLCGLLAGVVAARVQGPEVSATGTALTR